MNPNIAFEREAKIVLIGESFVGKSSIVGRFVTGNFDQAALATVGASFMVISLKVIFY